MRALAGPLPVTGAFFCARSGPRRPIGTIRRVNDATHPSSPDSPIAHGSQLGEDLVQEMTRAIVEEPRTTHLATHQLPSRERLADMMEQIRALMFPGFFGHRGLTEEGMEAHVSEELARVWHVAEEQIRRVMHYVRDPGAPGADAEGRLSKAASATRARELADRFLATFPTLKRKLTLDVQAGFDGDPAAKHLDETIFCYPGVDAIMTHRVAHELYKLEVPLLPRIIQEMVHSRTGIDVHPGATVGDSFFIDHGGGTVIGETTHIGNHVRIYQGVTLGNKSFQVDDSGRMIRGTKRHPTIGDRVVIYADACVLGGDTIIGDDCIISGSVYVTQSVPAGHIVRQEKPELILREAWKRSMDVPGLPVDEEKK